MLRLPAAVVRNRGAAWGGAAASACRFRPFASEAGAPAGGGRRGNRVSRGSAAGGPPERGPGAVEVRTSTRDVAADVQKHMEDMQEQSRKSFNVRGKPSTDWRMEAGHKVPYRFRIQEPQTAPKKDDSGAGPKESVKQQVVTAQEPYSNYAGLRFPTLETAENYDYHKDRGIDRVAYERAYPIKVPGYRRLDPYLREYIHFLHSLDPARFTIDRIAERYRLRRNTVAKVVQEWGVNRYLTRSGLTRLRDKQQTREAVILRSKEEQYAKWVGFDQLGDQEDLESDDEALGSFKGYPTTSDWVRRQTVEVEMMSAFPMPEKRDPMPKRVDVDMVVESRQHHKIINWIDPTDKVVF